MTLQLKGSSISIGIPGSPPAALLFSSIDSISGNWSDGSGPLANGSVIAVSMRLPQTMESPPSTVFAILEAAFLAATSETFLITEVDATTSQFTGIIQNWNAPVPPNVDVTTVPCLVTFDIRITSSITRGP